MRKKILVDTSVWIQFLHGVDSKEVAFLKEAIVIGELIYLCPIIVQEVLQGIGDDRQYDLVKEYLLAFNLLEWEPIIASISATDLYRSLRKKGVTVRKSNDCLIAAFAKKFNADILHTDPDFRMMADTGEINVVEF